MSEAPDGPVLLGYRKGGQPIFLIQGGAVDPPTFTQPPAADPPAGDPGSTDDPPPADPPEGDPPNPDDPPELGAAGKAAIDRMKARLKDETTKRKAAEAKAAELEAKNKPPKPPAGDDDAPTAEQLRNEARKEARAEVARDRALDRVEVLAAKTFNDPADARVFLAAQVDDFLDNGQPDAEAITEALADLLKARPYLALAAPRRWTANGDNGPRGGKPKDLDAQIAEAQAKGDTNAFIALQNQKLQQQTTT